jgi:ubiquitin-like-conjugating enzyme ATG10
MNSVSFTEDEFKEKVKEFIKISELLHDTWEIDEKGFYLKKRDRISILERNELQSKIITIDYHVVFHPSYQVPVLYFNGFNENGKMINLDDVAQIFADEYECNSRRDEIFNVISQSDHPVFSKPFFFIHPCKSNTCLVMISILTYLFICFVLFLQLIKCCQTSQRAKISSPLSYRYSVHVFD